MIDHKPPISMVPRNYYYTIISPFLSSRVQAAVLPAGASKADFALKIRGRGTTY